MKNKKLILGCGIGRCGAGFLSYFMFLNPEIAVWDGPGMGELFSHVNNKKGKVPLSDLHEVWGDNFQEPTHALKNDLDKWKGFDTFADYYKKRITERKRSSAYFISHVMGERWYPTYRRSFHCDIVAVYCAREMISHFRSFKRWYYVDGFSAESYLDRIRGSLNNMETIKRDGVPVVVINVADYSVTEQRLKMRNVMSKVGITTSKEQTDFLKYRRKLGPSKGPLNMTDAELLKELQQVSDFEKLKERYDALRDYNAVSWKK